jgi:hypothetical protein
VTKEPRDVIIKEECMEQSQEANRDPIKRIDGFVEANKTGAFCDQRILNYTEENVRSARDYYNEHLSKEIEVPDGKRATISQKDFNHFIADPVTLRHPYLIRDILEKAEIKIEMPDGKSLYFSRSEPGAAVFEGDFFKTIHHYREKDVERKLRSAIKKGGKIVWEKS